MAGMTDVQKERVANFQAAVTWFLVWWSVSLASIALILFQLPIELMQGEMIMSLSEITPAINIWAAALKDTPVMRVIWIYLTLSVPLAIIYMLYICRSTLLLRVETRLGRLVFPAVILLASYIYVILPATVYGEVFGMALFPVELGGATPSFGTGIVLGSFLGGIIGSWVMAVSFCLLTMLLILTIFRFLTLVINGVTHGFRKW